MGEKSKEPVTRERRTRGKVWLVRQTRNQEHIPAVPLVQGAPNSPVDSPADGGQPLALGADYRIAQIQVFDGIWEDPGSPSGNPPSFSYADIKPSVRVELRMAGKLSDPLQKILGVRVEVEDADVYNFLPTEFTDALYLKWYPQGTGGVNVRVEGLGVHHLRVVPTNASGFEGRYHLDVSIEVAKGDATAINDAIGKLAEVEDDVDSASADPAGYAVRLLAAVNAVAQAWRAALARVELRSLHNKHVPHPADVGASCYFRVRSLPKTGQSTGEVEAEPQKKHPIDYASDGPSLISIAPKPAYFVALDAYPETGPRTFDDDGLLRGQPTQMARGYRPPGGMHDEEVIYSVTGSGPACSCIKRGDSIELRAAGSPASWKGVDGVYEWSVVSYPEGAAWQLQPPGPSPDPRTRFKVDRTGHYVVKVDYTLDAPPDHCNQTFALIDVKVVLDVEGRASLWRVGKYPAELAEHVGRPFYRRRTLEKQEGADLMVLPVGAADFGQRLDLSFAAYQDLTLGSEFTARVYTKADRSAWRDYAGAPFVLVPISGAPAVQMHLESLERIHAVHLMRIRYRHLLRIEGHAVEVSASARQGDSCPGEIDDIETVAGPVVVDRVDGPPLTPTIPGYPQLARLVNLVLYENDLGRIPGKAHVRPLPGSDEIFGNVTNGNLHAWIGFFEWHGRGMSLEFALQFNSFRAQQMEAFERMARLNGVSDDELDREYARNPAGHGWSHTYAIHVIDYVLSEEGENIRKRVEVVGADGNHAQLEAQPALGTRFTPCERGTVFDGDPCVGASIAVEEKRDAAGALKGYELTDFRGNRWKFEDKGRVVEIASCQAVRSAGALKAVTIERLPGQLKVTDTVGRELRLETGPRERVRSVSDDTARKWELNAEFYHPQRLGGIVWPAAPGQGAARHVFQYEDEFNCMRWFTNRRGFDTGIDHALGSGRNDWGRLIDVSRDTLSWVVAYEDPGAKRPSVAVVNDARGTDRRYTWDRISLSLLKHEAKRKRIRTPFRILQQAWITLDAYEYFVEPGRGEGKLARSAKDMFGFKVTSGYRKSTDGRGYVCEWSRLDGRSLYTYVHDDATNLVKETTDANSRTTKTDYDTWGNHEKTTYPKLANQTTASVESWEYAADGKLLSHTDRAGVKTTYSHGGPRDPLGIGLPTKEERAGLAWEYSLHRCGKHASAKEPFFGGTTDYEIDVLDRVYRIKLPEITAVTGTNEAGAAAAREMIELRFDPNGNVEAREAPLGGTESATFDLHDRVLKETTSDGIAEVVSYDGYDGVTERLDRRGNTWKTERDYLGRAFTETHPASDGGVMVEITVRPDDGHGNVVEYLCGPRLANGQIGLPRRAAKSTFDWMGVPLARQRAYGMSPDAWSRASRWTYERDDYGHLKSITFVPGFRGTAGVTFKESYGLDNWDRIESVTVGDARTDYVLGPRDEIRAVTAPAHDGTSRSTWRFDYDDHLRGTATTDPYGTVIRQTVYHDAAAGVAARQEFLGLPPQAPAPTPRVHRSASIALQVLKTVHLNARGWVEQEIVTGRESTRYYYDVRGRMTVRVQGKDRSAYKLDARARRLEADVTSAGVTQHVEQRFDPAGNLLFLSGTKFDSRYEYDAKDQFVVEHRKSKVTGGAEVEFRRVTCDILGRPVKMKAIGNVETAIRYFDDLNYLSYTVTGLQMPVSGSVAYGWNGGIRSLSRTVGSGAYDLYVSDLDSCGRARKYRSLYHGMQAELEYTFNPAGTRASMKLTWGDPKDAGHFGTFTRTFRYQPDWLAKSITTPEGDFEFAYQANGVPSAWKTPRGLWNEIAFDENGEAAALKAFRAGGASRFLEWAIARHPQGANGAGKERNCVVTFHHAAGERPDTGTTTYSSDTTYDAQGRPTDVTRVRTNPVVRRLIGTSYKADGSPDAIGELHDFPATPLRRFDVEKRIEENAAGTQTFTSNTTGLDPTVRTAHISQAQTLRDAWGRPYRVVSGSLLDPDTFRNWLFGWIVSQEKWMVYDQVSARDELGRVFYVRGEPHSESATHSSTADRDALMESWLVHGVDGRLVGRTEAARTPVENQTYYFTNYEQRLYVYDGPELIAEVGRSPTSVKSDYHDRLVRYYDLGPGTGFRLSVNHRREIGGTQKYTTDDYLYGPGLVPVALAGQPNDGSSTVPGVVRRFPLWDMPVTGDVREERVHGGEAEDDDVLSLGSAVCPPAPHIALGGLPPGISHRAVAALGSAIGARLRDESLGSLMPHGGFFDYTHDSEPVMQEPGELTALPDRSILGAFGRILEFVVTYNPFTGFIYRLNKSKALVKLGLYAEAKSQVVEGSMGLAFFAVGHVAGLLSGLIGTVVRAGLTVYGKVNQIINLPDQLTLLAGRDPETGSSLSWDERLTSVASVVDVPIWERGVPIVLGGHGCFPAGTAVATPSGPRPIEALDRGDLVCAWSGDSVTERRVAALHRHAAHTLRLVTDVCTLSTSPSQPFLEARRGWTAASALRAGDSIMAHGGVFARVLALEAAAAGVPVFNLCVECDETYFVGDARVIAHNKPATMSDGVEAQRQSRAAPQFNMDRLKRARANRVFQYVEHPFVFVRADDPNYLERLQARVPRPGPGKDIHADHVTAKGVVNAANHRLWEHHEVAQFRAGQALPPPQIYFTAVAWLDARTNLSLGGSRDKPDKHRVLALSNNDMGAIELRMKRNLAMHLGRGARIQGFFVERTGD